MGFSGAGLILAADIVIDDALALLCAKPRLPMLRAFALMPASCFRPPRFQAAGAGFHPSPGAQNRPAHRNPAFTPPAGSLSFFCMKTQPDWSGWPVIWDAHMPGPLPVDPAKTIFCHEQPDCAVLAGGGACRFPDAARPSMSGVRHKRDPPHGLRRLGNARSYARHRSRRGAHGQPGGAGSTGLAVTGRPEKIGAAALAGRTGGGPPRALYAGAQSSASSRESSSRSSLRASLVCRLNRCMSRKSWRESLLVMAHQFQQALVGLGGYLHPSAPTESRALPKR